MNRIISFEEKKSIQLEMLKEIDSYCRNNNIRYSLAFGTLLGAIRHNGFIPWDDDVDLMMPYPDLIEFKKHFKSETMIVIDSDNYEYYEWQFPRICHTNTYNKTGKYNKSYGICIDLYPIVGMSEEDEEIKQFLYEGTKIQNKANWFIKWHRREMKYTPFSKMFGFKGAINKVVKYTRRYNYGDTQKYFIIAGPFDKSLVFDCDLFENLVEVTFEHNRFLAVSKYDYYLKQRYGDYMTPPPVEDRHPYHGGEYYWK